MKKYLLGTAAIATAFTSVPAHAATAILEDNRVIIDNAPFFSVGAEDGLGSGNFALNRAGFIDIPYAIFSFGGATSVSNATLNWDFDSLFGDSPPSSIGLYVGSDADGVVTTSDRFMGTLIDTSIYSGGEVGSFDVTSFVNDALGAGQFFAARFEVTTAPADVSGVNNGGNFFTPSLDFDQVAAVPEPATWAFMIFGFGAIGGAMRRQRKANVKVSYA